MGCRAGKHFHSLAVLHSSPSPVLRFGGGPAVNHLYVCSICQVEIEALAKRRKIEIDTFIKVGVGSIRKQCRRVEVGSADLSQTVENSCPCSPEHHLQLGEETDHGVPQC